MGFQLQGGEVVPFSTTMEACVSGHSVCSPCRQISIDAQLPKKNLVSYKLIGGQAEHVRSVLDVSVTLKEEPDVPVAEILKYISFVTDAFGAIREEIYDMERSASLEVLSTWLESEAIWASVVAVIHCRRYEAELEAMRKLKHVAKFTSKPRRRR